MNMSTETLYGESFFAGRSETVARSAAIVVPVLVELFQPASLLDVGCGQGEWVAAFGLEDSVGVDIAAPALQHYLRHDLTEPLELGRTFDLVLSLETGEHLPESAAPQLVDTIASHANHYVVFSAAVPGQGGIGHINCQTHDWWHQLFFHHGFEPQDLVRPRIALNPNVSPWYRDNIWAYVR